MVAFRGGDKLQAELNRIAKSVKSAGTLSVGFLEGATYPDGTSVPMVAAINEFGRSTTSGDGTTVSIQPPRPFFRNMIAKNSPSWPGIVGKALKQTNYDAKTALSLTGEELIGEVQESIQDLTSPPLAPSTIKRKGFEKPLVDSGVMIASVDKQVE